LPLDIREPLMACCDFPESVKVDLTGLASCLSSCGTITGTAWDGVLTDYHGSRCIYQVKHTSLNVIASTAYVNGVRTYLKRDQHRNGVWTLRIGSRCACSGDELVWMGHMPYFKPHGEINPETRLFGPKYLFVASCSANLNVQTVKVTAA
jgi:hypothetical protein